jgi:hypothetical protein
MTQAAGMRGKQGPSRPGASETVSVPTRLT